MSKNFQPSGYQQAIFNFITAGSGNAVIDAVAGSGKSTTIVNAIDLIPEDKSILFLAFNKAIVEELSIKIGKRDNVEINTLHSLGFTGIRSVFKTNLDNSKYNLILNNGLQYGNYKATKKLDYEDYLVYKSNIRKLVDLIRMYLTSDFETILDICDKYDIFIIDNEIDIALDVINYGIDIAKSKIDFTDMIFIPNVLNVRMKQYDFVLIDECQDLNTAQRELFLKCLKPDGRFIAVGDPRQAIYGFAGADIESFNILKSLPNTIELPLSVCYRCDNNIIGLAKTIVPQIEAKENANDGIVDYNAKLEHITDSDMVLCRVTAPLVRLCIQYIAQDIKAYVKGRDIGVNLINMIKKTNMVKISDVIIKLQSELIRLENKIMEKNSSSPEDARNDNSYIVMNDKINAIIVLSENLNLSNDVIRRIEVIFKDNDNAGICLSTIHKAKGLESNNVYIICPEKMLLKRAMKKQWTAQQEYNLQYVAYTRAKHKLGFITDFKFE